MNSLQFKYKTDTTFMSSENIEIFDPHKLLLDSTDKIIKKIKINKKNKKQMQVAGTAKMKISWIFNMIFKEKKTRQGQSPVVNYCIF